jgi:large subunit ribosomal protein L3
MRVVKGKKLPGQMGFDTKTVQNLTIIDVDLELNYILVSGNIPGAKNSLVLIKTAVKNSRKEDPKEILTFAEETVVDEVVETPEVAEEVTEVVEEVKDTKEETKEESK